MHHIQHNKHQLIKSDNPSDKTSIKNKDNLKPNESAIMSFTDISLHSPEIGVCQPNVYGDIESQLIKVVEQQKTHFIYLTNLIM